MVWSFTQVCHMDTVCGCQWFSVEILQCLLSSNCVLCTGKWHCDACTWFLRTLSLVLFVLFFLFPLLIVFSILVCNKIYNVNNFWVLENHSPWRRNERHRWHLKTTSGCVAQAGPKLILLPPVFLMLKFRVGATMHGSWYTPQWKTQHFSLRSRTRPWCPFLIGNCFRSSKKRNNTRDTEMLGERWKGHKGDSQAVLLLGGIYHRMPAHLSATLLTASVGPFL